jgi:hypothetical protein
VWTSLVYRIHKKENVGSTSLPAFNKLQLSGDVSGKCLFKASEESKVVSSAQTKRSKSERQLAFLHICDMWI